MRGLFLKTLALISAVGLAGSALGQGFPFQESRLNGAAILLRHEGVQAQLKLTKPQNDKVRETMKKVQDKNSADFKKLDELPDGRARSEFKRDLSQRVITEVTQALPDILTPDQMKRLQQIALQHGGVQAFDEKLVADKLRLTTDQLGRIKKIREDSKTEYMNVRQDLNMGFEDSKKKEHELQRKTVDLAVAALSEAQKKQWRELLGEPFEFRPGDNQKPVNTAVKPDVKLKVNGAFDNPEAVAKRVDEVQPTPDERKIDKIGWAKSIRQALDLGKAHNRPIIMHTYNDGRIKDGRC